jgi:cell division protein FtsZ
MAINLKAPEQKELRPRITVLGVGGAGGNAVNNMIAAKLEGVEFVVANTDAQALTQSRAERRIQMGNQTTEGLGAGAQPDVGRAAAEESLDEILEQIGGSHMVFITAGMGGGTGTGAAPVIARAVRELGVLTVGVVTKPFAFEGDNRMRIAERGIQDLQQHVHTLIVIPNQNLFRVANDRTTFAQAFAMADEVLHSGVRGVTDLIVMPGLINLDFADIKAVISEMGKAMMGTGESEGENRAEKAADMAICNPLLDDVSMKGARGVLINITGGPDLMLFEVEQAANRVRAEVDPDAKIIFGSTIIDNMEGRIRVSVVATGIDAMEMKLPRNVEPLRAPVAKPVPLRPDLIVDRVAPPVHNPVRHAQEALAAQMNAQPTSVSPDEDYILGGADAPEILDEPIPVSIRPQPMPIQAAAKEPEPERRGWGFLGRSRKPKDDIRMEPASPPQAQRPLSAPPRASAQPMTRNAPAEPPKQASQPSADDLFPDHKRDDQFEIPAFLRRQTN